MLRDIRRITMPNSKNQIFIGLHPELMNDTIFEPGSLVNIIYEKDKMMIVKDIESDKAIIGLKRISFLNSRNQIFLGLDPELIKETVFEPGTYVNVVYDKEIITIIKDIGRNK